jgi:hypothetical protein
MNPDRLARLFEQLANSTESPLDAVRTFSASYPRELAKVRAEVAVRRPGPLRAGGLYPVPIDGSPSLGLKRGYFMTPLRDGTIGYHQRRTDDCLQASLASLAQIPMAEVPDLRLYKAMFAGLEPEEIDRAATVTLDQWLDKCGLTMRYHAIPPTTGRWIGVMSVPGHFNDHCVVLQDKAVLWDSSNLLPPNSNLLPPGERDGPIAGWMDNNDLTVQDLDYGITIERR